MSKILMFFTRLCGFLLIFSPTFAAANVPTPKAKSPVSVSIQPSTIIENGNSVDIVISATVQISTDNIEISVQAPKGMILNSGSLSWNGNLSSGATKTLKFNASFSDIVNQQLTVKALIQNPNNSQFSARAEYTINKTSSTLTAVVSNQSRTVARGTGSVVEYEVTK